MQPAAPRRRPVAVRAAPSHELHTGDLICGECGEGNAATRKFCSRCGGSLAAAEVHHIPWYRRILPERFGGEREAKPAKDATRPKPRHRVLIPATLVRTGRALVAMVVVIAMIAYGVVTPFRNWVNGSVSHIELSAKTVVFPTFDPVRPSGASASSQTADHPASAAIDLYNNTFWAADLHGDHQPTLTLTFSTPVDVDTLLFTSGDRANYTAEARPMDVHIVTSTGNTQDLQLSDHATPQRIDVDGGRGIVRLDIQIRSVYPSAQSSLVALTEVEPFVKH